VVNNAITSFRGYETALMAACDPISSIIDLNLDAWVAISEHLGCDALAHVSTACKGLNQLVAHNHSLWSAKFKSAWPETFSDLSGVHDWPGLYKQSVLAACQVHCCCCTANVSAAWPTLLPVHETL
jgi:hypothetical protein